MLNGMSDNVVRMETEMHYVTSMAAGRMTETCLRAACVCYQLGVADGLRYCRDW